MPFLAMWSLHLLLTAIIQEKVSSKLRNRLEQVTAAVLQRNSRQVVRKLCESESSGQKGSVSSESSFKRICRRHNGTSWSSST